MRDPTRGGVAAAVCDIARASNVGIRLREDALPIGREVRGACDLLGLDPLTIANEGKVLVFCRLANDLPKLRFPAPGLCYAPRHPLIQMTQIV